MWWMLFFLVVAGVHALRQHVTHKTQEQLHFESFEGEIYTYGAAVIGKQPAKAGSAKSIVCFPGFTEDMRYFTQLYQDVDAELILINNANYHSPFRLDQAQPLHWAQNPYTPGLIRHDAFVMSQVLKNLVRHDKVIVHGHSRGAAVVLETGTLVPELTKNITAVLEAPVVPQGKVYVHVPRMFKYLAAYFLPLVFASLRRISARALDCLPMMHPGRLAKQKC